MFFYIKCLLSIVLVFGLAWFTSMIEVLIASVERLAEPSQPAPKHAFDVEGDIFWQEWDSPSS